MFLRLRPGIDEDTDLREAGKTDPERSRAEGKQASAKGRRVTDGSAFQGAGVFGIKGHGHIR